MGRTGIRTRLLGFASLGMLIFGCAGGESKREDAAPKIHSVSLDSLTPYKQVFLKVGPDTLRNCDTASDYKEFVKVPSKDGTPKRYDAFAVNGDPIVAETFLKVVNDSVYFMATVENRNKGDSYVSLCVERRFISETMMAGSPAYKPEGRKGRGGHGGGRRHGGFG
jgi:hypothetical protein